MQPFRIIALFWLMNSASAQDAFTRMGFGSGRNEAPGVEQDRERRQMAREELKKSAGLARHPFRVVNAETNNVTSSPGWCHFYGKVAGVYPDGIHVRGHYNLLNGASYQGEEIVFFVTQFPIKLANDDPVPFESWYLAKDSGLVSLGSRALHKLDYGIPVLPPPSKTPSEIAALALKMFQDLAARGDAYGQYKLGCAYRDGAGVAKDLGQACAWLQKSAAQGHAEAATALAQLPKN